MDPPRRHILAHGSRLIAACCALATLAIAVSARGEDTALVISVAEPEGFAALAAPREMVVDLRFGGERLGEARIIAGPGYVRFVDPAAVVASIPSVTDKDAVRAALAAETLPSNAQLVCSPRVDKAECGRLSPDIAGVIFDAEHFRLDLFLNPRFLEVQQASAERYLPEPQAGLGIINSIGAVLSGNDRNSFYEVQDRLIVGSGDARLRVDSSYSTDTRFEAQRIALEIDRPERRYSAGALWAPGLTLLGRRKLLGAAVETQIDTRLDKDTAIGTPLVVFLAQRARIDAISEGRILSSRIYDAGNQQIDTSAFPEGSYEVILRIDEAGLGVREERRFFTKSRRIPPSGGPAFFAFGGLLIDEPLRHSLSPSGKPYLQGGIAQRIGQMFSLDGSLELIGDSVRGEVGANLSTPIVWARAAAIGTADGGYGGLVQIGSAGNSRFNFNFDLRRAELGKASPIALPDSSEAAARVFDGDPFFFVAPEAYSQVSGTASFSFADVRFLASASYRDVDGGDSTYNFGPSFQWDVLRQGRFTLSLRGDLAVTDQGEAGFLGVSLRMLGGRSSMTASLGARSSGLARDDLGSGVVASLAGTWTDPDFAGGELALGAGYERDPRRSNLIASGELRSEAGSFAADIVHSSSADEATTQYSLGFQTTMGWHGGAIALDGRSTSESMVTAEIAGARPTDSFEVLVDEQTKATLSGGERVALSLPSYRSYDLRIRPVGGGLVSYDGSTRRIGLYPGSVTALSWEAKPVKIIVGRLLSPGGRPIANALLAADGGWGQTDANGYFQIETSDQAEVEVTLADGRSYRTILPPSRDADEFASVGEIECCGLDGADLASRDTASIPAIKDRRR